MQENTETIKDEKHDEELADRKVLIWLCKKKFDELTGRVSAPRPSEC